MDTAARPWQAPSSSDTIAIWLTNSVLGTLCFKGISSSGGSDSKESALSEGDTMIQSLGQEGTLEKGIAAHSSVLAWKISWAEEPGGLQRVWATESELSQLSLSRLSSYHTPLHKTRPPQSSHHTLRSSRRKRGHPTATPHKASWVKLPNPFLFILRNRKHLFSIGPNFQTSGEKKNYPCHKS